MAKALQKLVHGILPFWLSKLHSTTLSSSRTSLLSPVFAAAASSRCTSGESPSVSQPSTAIAENALTFADESGDRLCSAVSSCRLRRRKPGIQKGSSRTAQKGLPHRSDDVKPRRRLQDLLLQDGISPQWRDDDDDGSPDRVVARPREGGQQSRGGWMRREDEESEAALCSSASDNQQTVCREGVSSMERKSFSVQSDGDEEAGPRAGGQSRGGRTCSEDEEPEEALGSSGLDQTVCREGVSSLKRKSFSVQSDGDEEQGKRMKAESGAMSRDLPESVCRIVGNGRAVVKHAQNPELAVWESMVEMIVGNGLWELGSLDFLLFCYLSLNEPHLHPIIQSCFLRVLTDLQWLS